MKLLTVARAVAWLGVAITWWSLNVVWGDTVDAGKGPPGQWQRHVVGAGLLAMIAAMSLSVSGRHGNPPSWLARGIALACAAGIGVIALVLRSDAMKDFPHLIEGPGWTWLVAGGGFVLAATTFTLGLAPPEKSKASAKGKKRRKKR